MGERVKGAVESVDDLAFIKALVTRAIEEKLQEFKKQIIADIQRIVRDEVDKKQLVKTVERVIERERPTWPEPSTPLVQPWTYHYTFTTATSNVPPLEEINTVSDWKKAKQTWLQATR